jgi:hypothetical protein
MIEADHHRPRRIIMTDNELPPIEGELTDEDLRQVSGGNTSGNGGPPPPKPPGQNYQGNDDSQGNQNQH